MARVAMFVYNDCRTDARVLREAAALVAAGHEVTVYARPAESGSTLTEREERDGFSIVRVPVPTAARRRINYLRSPRAGLRRLYSIGRYGLRTLPRGLLALGLAALVGLLVAPIALPLALAQTASRRLRPAGKKRQSALDLLINWRFAIGGWADAAGAAAGPADVYHGHDLTGLPAALAGARRWGGRVVYDSHEIFIEAGSIATRSRPIRAILRHLERRWAARADALVTVNAPLARHLGPALGFRRPVVVHNTPALAAPAGVAPDALRRAAGVPPGSPIALYHGGFSAHRGLEQLAEALLEPGMAEVHAVYLGYGSLRDWLLRAAADPRYGGRLHVLDAVSPDLLVGWVAGADVGVMAIQPSTMNHRNSTPNKLFECMAAGVPVVASDFESIREIVLDPDWGPLGRVCDPADVAALARAIVELLELPAAERDALRARIRAAAAGRWNWERESAGLIELYRELLAAPLGAPSRVARLATDEL